MSQQGFDYLTNPLPETPGVDPIPRLSVAAAETEGYRQMLDLDQSVSTPRVSEQAQLPGYAEALDPSDESRTGCFDQAYRELFGDLYGHTALDMFRSLPGSDLTPTVESMPEIIALFADWAGCMGNVGFSYLNPGDAVFQFIGPAAGPTDARPSADEIRVAVADASCRKSIGYEARYTDAYTSAFSKWLTDNEAALQEIAAQEEVDMLRVRQVAKDLGMSS